MRKIHVLFRKEDIDPERIRNCVAVVFDVLFATSSIAAALYHGAKDVIPVKDGEEAQDVAKSLPEGSWVLAGEKDGYTMDGFLHPTPLAMETERIRGKSVIYSTTNGTVAIRKAEQARSVYTSSLLNGEAVARQILADKGTESVVLICAGSKGSFGLDDFYGAGYLVDLLVRGNDKKWHLSDAAKAAQGFYATYPESDAACLRETRVGRFVSSLGLDEETVYAARKSILPVVPGLVDGRLIDERSDVD